MFYKQHRQLDWQWPHFLDQTQVKAIEQDHSGWTVSASWGWGGFTSPSSPLPGSSPTSCSGYFPPRLMSPNSFLFSAQGQHHICYRVYDQVSIWSDKNQHNFRATEISFIRPTNDSPVVAWSLDQKESIKSAFFIGYVIMQVIDYFKHSQLCVGTVYQDYNELLFRKYTSLPPRFQVAG